MARTDRAGAASAYVVASVTLGLLAAWSGYAVGRALR